MMDVEQEIKPPCFFNYFMLRSAILLKWPWWNRMHVHDLTNQLVQEQTNIGLVAALNLSIAAGFIELGDKNSEMSVAGDFLFMFFCLLSMMLAAVSMILSVVRR